MPRGGYAPRTMTSSQRLLPGLAPLIVVLSLGASTWLAAACRGPAKPPRVAVGSASASASVPLFTQSSGASPIHAAWKAGACDVEMRDALGASYQLQNEGSSKIEDVLRETVDACLRRSKGTQGTLYIEAKVAANGALADVDVAPGGAMSTEVVECLTGSLGKVRVAAPKEAESVLLLFVVSACAPL